MLSMLTLLSDELGLTDDQAKLLEVHRRTEELRQAGRIERVVLAVNRSDYMLDEPSNTLLQVAALTL